MPDPNSIIIVAADALVCIGVELSAYPTKLETISTNARYISGSQNLYVNILVN